MVLSPLLPSQEVVERGKREKDIVYVLHNETEVRGVHRITIKKMSEKWENLPEKEKNKIIAEFARRRQESYEKWLKEMETLTQHQPKENNSS